MAKSFYLCTLNKTGRDEVVQTIFGDQSLELQRVQEGKYSDLADTWKNRTRENFEV